MRKYINRMFTWANMLRKVCSFILFICVTLFLWLPITSEDPADIMELPLFQSNNSLTKAQLRGWTFVSKYLSSFHQKRI